MNYHIEIENLGAIEKAKFEITPMTILAGKNGTGKSFVTKFLYSVLSLGKNEFAKEIFLVLSNTKFYLSNILKNQITSILPEEKKLFNESFEFIEFIINFLDKNKNNIYNLSNVIGIIQQVAYFNNYLQTDLIPYFRNEKESLIDKLEGILNENLNNDDPSMIWVDFNYNCLELSESLDALLLLIKNPNEGYISFLEKHLKNSLIENFQISEIRKLIHFNSNFAKFIIFQKMIITIKQDNSLKVKATSKDILDYLPNNKIIFFESPVYWKLLTIINENDFSFVEDEILTGVPKHFYDLKELVFTNFKNNERPQFIIDCANNLEQSLQGKFRTTLGSDLVFENKQGQAIDKSLVSFGMTNLGILQAVLNKNIINKGSFIFIDEPESNLHPEWQTLLAETLVYLAKNGVYVIITSHSTDMLKAFDIATQEQKLEDKLSAHYFQMDGTLLEMNDEHLTDIEQARQKLMENYDDLTMRGYLL